MNENSLSMDENNDDDYKNSEVPAKTKLARRRKIEEILEIQKQRRLMMELNDYDI